MAGRFLLKLVIPLIAISMLLLGMGAVAAWNVQRQQAVNSTLIAREVQGMLAAQSVDVGMREIRHQLNQYLRNHQPGHLDQLHDLHSQTDSDLSRAHDLARTPGEKELIGVVEDGYRRFWNEFQRISAPEFMGDRDEAFGRLIDTSLTDTILNPGRRYIEHSRNVVERTNETSRETSDQMRQGFLLLGVCGGAAGLVTGLAIARAVSRSIVQLDVSVRGVAGKLSQVAGPVSISSVGGFGDLEAGLRIVEDHLADVVQRLQRSELEVLRNEQLAAVGQLAAGVAHELRNPLMPMKMLVQAALERDDGCGLCGRQLEVVEEEIERLESAIQMFLEFARPTPIEKSMFDLVGVAEQTLELLAGRAEAQGVALVDRFPPGPVMVEADCGQIRQVLLNLLLNAFDSLAGGGEVRLEIDTPRAGEAGAQWTTLRVLDSGPGIPPEILERIFEPFVTTKETGTGLGLSICRRIVMAHGGEIAAENLPGHGARFVIHLPTPTATIAAGPPVGAVAP